MTNEAILRVQTSLPINFTCADGTGIEKGAILALSDPMTAATAAAAIGKVAGICAAEKIANNGQTMVSVYREGIFDMVASGAIVAGEGVENSSDATYPNTVHAHAVNSSGACFMGTALETATDGERILIDLHCGVGCNGIA